jgi:hypothetical protein
MTEEKDFSPMFTPPKNYQLVWLQDIGKRELKKLLLTPVAEIECRIATNIEQHGYDDTNGCYIIGNDAYFEMNCNVYRISKTKTKMYVFVRKSTRKTIDYVCGYLNENYRKKEGLPPLSDTCVLTNGIWKPKGAQK